MKIRDSLGVPDNLRAMENMGMPEPLKRDRDSVEDRKDEMVRMAGKPNGTTSAEISSALGYSHSAAATPLIKKLIEERRIYRDKWRYYKVQPGLTNPEVVVETPPEPPIPEHYVTNEDRVVVIVEELAKDFVWQADCDISSVKRFVEYLKSKREGQ